MSLQIPTRCPVCGGEVRIEKKYNTEVLVCINPFCTAKIEGKILHFINRLEIDAISTATVKDLINFGWLSRMSDIFLLKNHRDEWISKKGYGENSVDKIIEGIPTSVELWKIIASAGIPNVEKQTAIIIADYFRTWEAFREAVDVQYPFTKLPGIGDITASLILNFNYNEIDEVMQYITIKQKTGGKLDNMTFCITGKLSMKRDDLVKIIEANGGKISSVGKGLNYLICNEPSTSSKYKKAIELSIPIINENEFMALIK